MDSLKDHIQLPTLNLPHFEPKLRRSEDKLWILDLVRKKHLVLTPEEWVRQHWINFLISHQNFPKGLIALERELKYNQLKKRTDLVVWDNFGKPYLLVECKAPNIVLSQKTMEQACLYHQEIKSPYLIISNGNQHIFMAYNSQTNQFNQERNCPPSPI